MNENNLRKERLAQNISLTEMSNRLGLSKGYLSGVETGHQVASEKVLRGYELVLGADPGTFLTAQKEECLTLLVYVRSKKDVFCAIQNQREHLEAQLVMAMDTQSALLNAKTDLNDEQQRFLAQAMQDTIDLLDARIFDLHVMEESLA